MGKLYAYFNTCRQTSPDDFEGHVMIKDITKETTVEELLLWVKSLNEKQLHIHIVWEALND